MYARPAAVCGEALRYCIDFAERRSTSHGSMPRTASLEKPVVAAACGLNSLMRPVASTCIRANACTLL